MRGNQIQSVGSGARKEEFMFGEVAGIGVEEELEEFGGLA